MVTEKNVEEIVQDDDSLLRLARSQALGAAGGMVLGATLDHYNVQDIGVLLAAVKTISGMGDTLTGFYYTHVHSRLFGSDIGDEAKQFSSMNMLGVALGNLADIVGGLPEGSIAREVAFDAADNITSMTVNGVRSSLRGKLMEYLKKPYVVGTLCGIGIITTLHTLAKSVGLHPEGYLENALLTGAFNINSYCAYAATKFMGNKAAGQCS